MQIICPNCQYSQAIPDDKIPRRSVLATCPKCKHKFRFREPEFIIEDPGPAQAATPPVTPDAAPQPETAPEPATAREPSAQAPEPTPEPTPTTEIPPVPDEDDTPDRNQDQAPSQEKPRLPLMEGVPETDVPAAAQVPDTDVTEQDTDPDAGAERKGEPESASSSDTPPPPPGEDDSIWKRLEDLAADENRAAGENRASEKDHAAPAGIALSETDEDPDQDPSVPPPWEQLDDFGFFPGMFQTIKRVCLHPVLFFRAMPVAGGMGKPLIFYLLISEFMALCDLLWKTLGINMIQTAGAPDVRFDPAMMFGLGSVFLLVLYPLFLAGGLFVSAGMSHVLLMLMKAGNRGFEATFRVMAYSAAPMVLAVFPLAGPLVGALWGLTITFIGLKHVHRTKYWRIIVAYHIPVAILFTFVIIMALAARFLQQHQGMF